jgi:pimeloyl-ACP methyl ester carboxylesterase
MVADKVDLMSSTADDIEYPSTFAPLTEVRAVLEVASFFAYRSVLEKMSPEGDGHTVLTLPPFMSDDKFMSPMRKHLHSLGYDANGWELEQNTGVDDRKFAVLAKRITRAAEKTGKKVSLIGHSLGGIYARLLAHEIPDAVRQVIYLGTPFNISDEASVDLPIRRIYEKVNPTETPNELMQGTVDIGATPMPSTAIYSEGDGFVPWRFCIDEVDEITENIRVAGSHTGLPFNLPVLFAVADRLAQPADNWKPFSFHGARKCLFSPAAA